MNLADPTGTHTYWSFFDLPEPGDDVTGSGSGTSS